MPRELVGQVVDVALYEAVFSLMESTLPEFDVAAVVRERSGSALPGIAPTNTYRSREGSFVVIAGNSDPIFRRLMTSLAGRSWPMTRVSAPTAIGPITPTTTGCTPGYSAWPTRSSSGPACRPVVRGGRAALLDCALVPWGGHGLTSNGRAFGAWHTAIGSTS